MIDLDKEVKSIVADIQSVFDKEKIGQFCYERRVVDVDLKLTETQMVHFLCGVCKLGYIDMSICRISGRDSFCVTAHIAATFIDELKQLIDELVYK